MIKTYMTVAEFVEAYASGLEATLSQSFRDGQPAHLEDLMAWTTTYSENAFQFVSALPTEPRPTKNEEENWPPTGADQDELAGKKKKFSKGKNK